MEIYLVGGAVRDQLLGLPVKEKDYVVVGATPEDLLARGFQPVGKDFPVFLDPHTHDEYALARTERKQGRGYKGFTFYAASDVTLEQDLLRRDLTINAIAQDEKSGKLFYPPGALEDLKQKVLRHVSPAFEEDPLRVLRLARFKARFAHLGFDIAPETKVLLKKMVQLGELHDLTPERVWQEMACALATKHPSAFFHVLEECGALERLFPEWVKSREKFCSYDKIKDIYAAVDHAAQSGASVDQCFAMLFHILLADKLKDFCHRWRVPKSAQQLAIKTAEFFPHLKDLVQQADLLSAEALLSSLELADALRQPEQLQQLSQIAEWLSSFARFDSDKLRDIFIKLKEGLELIAKLHFAESEKMLPGEEIKQLVRAKRIKLLNNYLGRVD